MTNNAKGDTKNTMNTPQHLLNDRQSELVQQLVDDYGISPDEITFFAGEPDPTLGYEASCVMCNFLAPEIIQIDVNPIESPFVDSLAVRCSLADEHGRSRSAVGVVNASERIGDEVMNPQQRYQAATSRAIRNALRVAGIDLLKRHAQRRSGLPVDAVPGKSNRRKLVAQAHALGVEAGFIINDTKDGWRRMLWHRYGVDSSAHLGEHQLADLVAALRGILAGNRKKAA